MILPGSFSQVPEKIAGDFPQRNTFFSGARNIIEQKGQKTAYMKNLCFEKAFHMMV